MEKEKKLSNTTIGFMIATALFFDGFQLLINLIPILGQILSVIVGFFAFLTFYFWGEIKGFKFNTPKRGSLLGGGFIIEAIPFLNILPAWTLAVILLVLDQKRKDIISAVSPTQTSTKEKNN